MNCSVLGVGIPGAVVDSVASDVARVMNFLLGSSP
jgi:hypothetical protein